VTTRRRGDDAASTLTVETSLTKAGGNPPTAFSLNQPEFPSSP
jgi:hypothetical protein